MSLLKRNKDKQLAAEMKLMARHAIVKMGVDRNVRDAYFQGLVFAAVANDDQIDESERTRLRELGKALELPAEEVAEAIQCLADIDDDAKMGVIEECARQLTNVDVAEYFLKEFSELWFLGGGNKDEFEEFRSQLIDWMGDDVRMSEEKKVKAAEEAEAKRKAEEAAAIEAKRKTEEAEMRERELERQRKIDAERKAEEERFKAESTKQEAEERFYKNVSDWLSIDAKYGHLPENWRETLREKYDTSSLGGGFLANVYHVLMRRMKELLPAIYAAIDEKRPFDDTVWKVALTRIDENYRDTYEYSMFLALCQALISLSHGDDFMVKFDGGPLLLMKVDEDGNFTTFEWIDKFGWMRDTAKWFWLKGKYIRCELGEFRRDKYHMSSTRAREIAKSFFREIVKQIELMFVDLV